MDHIAMKTTSRAHPIQGLIKYHGLRDEKLRLPYHDSISVCTGPISTKTTVEFREELIRDEVVINSKLAQGRELERAVAVLEKIRSIAGVGKCFFKVESVNDFPTNVGLGASSSGFAALAHAAAGALELDLGLKEISTIARLGAGSAARSVTGGFSRWVAGTGDETSYSYRLDNNLEIGMLAVLVRAFKQTEDAHKAVTTSPFFQARLDYIEQPLADMEKAIERRDIPAIGRLAEMDTMNLHGITMTSVDEMFLWRPETVRAIQIVKKMREAGRDIYFSIDTGATVYLNMHPEDVIENKKRFLDEGFEVLELNVAPPVTAVSGHLF